MSRERCSEYWKWQCPDCGWVEDVTGEERVTYLDAYGDGWIAYYEHATENDCPYQDHELYHAWLDGFKDAVEQASDDQDKRYSL